MPPFERQRQDRFVVGGLLALAVLCWVSHVAQLRALTQWVAQSESVCAGLPSFAPLVSRSERYRELWVATDLPWGQYTRAFFCAQLELAPVPLRGLSAGRSDPGGPAQFRRFAANVGTGGRIAYLQPGPGSAEQAQQVLRSAFNGRARVELRRPSPELALLEVHPRR